MADADSFNRTYVVVDGDGPADAAHVADLLDTAATALRQRGEITVHHLALDVGEHAGSGISLTVYYDRVERRRHPRV